MGRIKCFYFFSLIVIVACKNKPISIDGFKLTGQINNAKAGTTVYLRRDTIADSTILKDGNFQFEGKLPHGAEAATLEVKGTQYISNIWLDKGEITFAADSDLSTPKITGSFAQVQEDSLNTSIQPLSKERDSLTRIMITTKGDNKEVAARLSIIQNKVDSIYLNFVKNRPISAVSLDILRTYYSTWDKSFVTSAYNQFSNDYKNSAGGREIGQYLKLNKDVSVGKHFSDFTQFDQNNHPVKLSNYSGHPIILDFWASWCGPCQRSNSELKQINQRYKDKGLVIIAVAVDDDQKAWKETITKNGLNWVNVSQFKGKSTAALTYGVNSFPTTFLINKQGLIVKKQVGQSPIEPELNKIL